MSRHGHVLLAALAIGACGGPTKPGGPPAGDDDGSAGSGGAPVDRGAGGSAGGSGGSAGAGGSGGAANGGAGGSSSGGAGGKPADARLPDPPLDAARDVIRSEAPTSGGPGCGPGSLCQNVRVAYAEAVLRAQSCTVGSACSQEAAGSLGCGGCAVWVTSRAELEPLLMQFQRGGCADCVFDGLGGRCHPTICPDLLRGICTAGAGGRGTCTIEKQPEQCPAGTTAGQACPLAGWSCNTTSGPARLCYCLRDAAGQLHWSCFGRP